MRKPVLALITITGVIVLLVVVLRATDSGPQAAPPTTAATDTNTLTTQPLVVASTALPPGTVVCDLYTTIVETGAVESADLIEASGLAASRVVPGVLWSHNDSRGSATLYAFTSAGEDLGAFSVPGAFALDWEDMSAGPGPDGQGSYLYVGDIGDNFGIRSGLVTVYRVPDVDPADMDGAFTESVPFTYRFPTDGYNTEALFIDPRETAIYLVTKSRDEAAVFRGSLVPGTGIVDLTLVTTLSLGAEVTAADMGFDGATLVMRGYDTVWMWHRDPGESIDDMLSAEPCTAPSPHEHQGEAITLDDDFRYWTVSEGANTAVQTVGRDA